MMLQTTGRRLAWRVARSSRLGGSAVAQQKALARNQQSRTIFGFGQLFGGQKDEDKDKQQTKPQPQSDKQHHEQPQASSVDVTNNNKPEAAEAVSSVASNAAPKRSQTPTKFIVGKYARLADGSVMACCGKTSVLTTAVSDNGGAGEPAKDYLPLMVDYRIKYFATGLIPDTVKRTEYNGTDDEILCSRVIDRCLRPLFPREFCDDTQIIATVQSFDEDNDDLVLAVNSASAALCVSDIPFEGPLGCVRVVDYMGELIVNPTNEQKQMATLNLLFAGNESKTLMIEAEGQEVSDDRMVEALKLAQEAVLPIIEQQKQLMKEVGKPKRAFKTGVFGEVLAKAKELGLEQARGIVKEPRATKNERQGEERKFLSSFSATLAKEFPQLSQDDPILQHAAHDVFQMALREEMLNKRRFDGRSPMSVRNLNVETSVLPVAHGSAVFTRGDTQSLCSVTLGPLDRGLRVRGPVVDQGAEIKHAMLHYEFPPYCVNETGRIGGTNRRMIGHGALAEKAIVPVIPPIQQFPYTIRMTAETMGSDGSSSMASICGVSAALYDAGVPIKDSVAGISVGLITEGDPHDSKEDISTYRLFTDILGIEDHYGDMDFKVAGTKSGITAIQLDVKLAGGIPVDILCEAIAQAKTARLFILRIMGNQISEPRKELGNGFNLPHVSIEFTLPHGASIGNIIGQGGSTIRQLEEESKCQIKVDRRTNHVRIVGAQESLELAKQLVLEKADVPSNSFYEKGKTYNMKVVELLEFGAVLQSTTDPTQRGFVHISELRPERVANIREELRIGDELDFMCIQEGVSGKMSRKSLAKGSLASTGASSSSSSRDNNSDSFKSRRPRRTPKARRHSHPSA